MAMAFSLLRSFSFPRFAITLVLVVLTVAPKSRTLAHNSSTSSASSSTGNTDAALVTTATSCFDDVASATVVSQIIFEGRVSHVSVSSAVDSQQLTVEHAIFRVKTLLKGSLQLSSSASSTAETDERRYRPVAVAMTSREQNGGNCDEAIPKLVVGEMYIVFAGEKIGIVKRNTTSGRHNRRPISMYALSRRPEMWSESSLKVVRQYIAPHSGKLAFCYSIQSSIVYVHV